MALAITLEKLYRPICSELEQVQARVGDCWRETITLVDGTAVPPPKAGGKMMRPALCLLAAGAAGATDLDSYVGVATAFELLHLAALVHDDVIDRAVLRRGTVSLNAQWDDRTAVLSGDYLVARAVRRLVDTGSCPLIENTFDAVRCMTEGELESLGDRSNQFTKEDCLRVAMRKTATLFAACCTAATYVRDETYRAVFHDYGLSLGIAFQLVDDVLDITQRQEILGKPSCGDIAQGKKTLPLLFMREYLRAEDKARLDRMIGHAVCDEDRAWALAVLESSGSLARTEAVATEYADAAYAALEPLPPGRFKESMQDFTRFVLIRGS